MGLTVRGVSMLTRYSPANLVIHIESLATIGVMVVSIPITSMHMAGQFLTARHDLDLMGAF